MAEDHACRGKTEDNAETLTVLLQKYTDGLKDLDHFTSNPDDASNETAAIVKDIRAVIAHLLERGEDMKVSFTNQTEINDTWRNLGHTLKTGLKLIKKLLKEIRPDPVQELGSTEISNIFYVLCCYRGPLEKHRDEVDAGVVEIVPCTEFFQQHRAALEDRISLLRPFLSKLEQVKVLNDGESQYIESKQTEPEKNNTFLKMLRKKGTQAQQAFYKVLKEMDPYLVENLENPGKLNEDLQKMGT